MGYFPTQIPPLQAQIISLEEGPREEKILQINRERVPVT